VACGSVEVAAAPLRSGLRERSAAGGNADLPADWARRRSIEAARPLNEPDARDCVAGEVDIKRSGERVSAIPRDTR
jgi:hypothetical protein